MLLPFSQKPQKVIFSVDRKTNVTATPPPSTAKQTVSSPLSCSLPPPAQPHTREQSPVHTCKASARASVRNGEVSTASRLRLLHKFNRVNRLLAFLPALHLWTWLNRPGWNTTTSLLMLKPRCFSAGDTVGWTGIKGAPLVGKRKFCFPSLLRCERNSSSCLFSRARIFNNLFAEVEVNSGGYLPSRFGEVNIHRYSPTLRRIIVLVYTTQS